MVLTPSRGAAVVRSNFEPVVSTVLFHSRGTRGCPIFTFSFIIIVHVDDVRRAGRRQVVVDVCQR